ncbi:hypothetical protein BDW22DRAFT_1296069, partial [Trametopsis cervina]
MSTPRSLPTTDSQRIATTLPFAPTPVTSPAKHRMQSQSRPHSGSNASSTSKPHNRSGSIISSRSRHQPSLLSGELFSPPPPLPLTSPRGIHNIASPTGIPASSSFFHPPRPYGPLSQTVFARPSSPGSIASSEAHQMSPARLGPFQKQDAHDTDYSGSINLSSTEDLNMAVVSKVNKHSREPLLPIGANRPRKSTISSRPSISVTDPYGRGDGGASPGSKMRGSFEKLFRRGSSHEGVKKGSSPVLPSASPGAPSPTSLISRSKPASPVVPHANPALTFDITAINNNNGPDSPLHAYKRSSSPADSTASIHHTNFYPTPPQGLSPLPAFTPMVDPETGKPIRNWQQHPSRNRFFLRGLLMTGGDTPWAFIGSLTLTLAIAGTWFGTTCVWWWQNESPAVAAVGAYMCLLTLSSMAATAFRDPGILPRNLDSDPPLGSAGSEESLRQPLPRDLKVRAGTVRVKYCTTCKTYRPPRSSHCKMCDNCVDGCDHHCQWVNNCVGRRNYTSFFMFLTSAVLTLVLVICTAAIHLWLLTRARFDLTLREALKTSQGTGSAVVFCLAILVIWPVTALLVYHARLLLLNVTTIEQIRLQAHKSLVPGPTPPNPFSHGNWRRNLMYVLCRTPGYSWADFPAVATQDKRAINPGLADDGGGD